MGPKDYVICADEKTGIQALGRPHPTRATRPGHVGRVEHEYVRGGTVAYLAALDISTGQATGRVEDRTGSEPFMHLVDQIMGQEPYLSADRVFWIVDNGSAHHPKTFAARLAARYPNAMAIHLPVHARWLNQAELFFAIVQRKAPTPNDLATLEAVKERLCDFEARYNQDARPFTWRFARRDLEQFLQRVV